MAKLLNTPLKQGKCSRRSLNAKMAAGTLVPAATATVRGTVLKGAAVAAAAGAAPTAAEYLALLTSLRNAGIITT